MSSMDMKYRIGFSRDIHRLEENNRPFIVGGVKLDFIKGPVSHSDGDCLYHAISESILGALSLGDLGKLFPDNDEKYLDYDSSLIVKETVRLMKEAGYAINNIDTSIILEKPKLAPFIMNIRENIATLLECDICQVSVKAQTNEKCGEVGNSSAIECQSMVMLIKDDNK